MNPDEMYAAVASRGGEAYKTKAGANSQRSSVTGVTSVAPVEHDPLQRGADSCMADEMNDIKSPGGPQPSSDTKRMFPDVTS